MTHFLSRTALRTAFLLACAAPAAVHAQGSTPAPAAPAAAAAQPAGAHPNLSGTWELNAAKSNFGMAAAPPSGTMTIAQSGDSFTRTLALGGDAAKPNTMRYTAGATRSDTIPGPGGRSLPITSTMRWDGPVLVIDAKANMMGTEIPIVARNTLSPDGKQLTVDQVVTTPMGDQTTHLVFDKKA